MPDLLLLGFVAVLTAGLVLLLRREHHLLSQDEDDPPRLDTRGPDDR